MYLAAVTDNKSPDYRSMGLFARYAVERSDGKPLDQGEQLFTLRFDKDDAWGDACRQTLREFSARIERLGYTQLAQDLQKRLVEVEANIQKTRNMPLRAPEL
jgi:hypothetical protein